MPYKTKIRVLVVDDSYFMRRVIRDLLNTDSAIEVVGEARDGLEAVKLVQELNPHVVTMDYNMPKMDGAKATEKILKSDGPHPAIIVLSAHTKDGIQKTFKSLNVGAVDFIAKPSGELSIDIEKVKGELLQKIKIASDAKVQISEKIQEKSPKKKRGPIREYTPQVVVIGASTGGPPILEKILSGIPNKIDAAIFVVQHMPTNFTGDFAKFINKNVNIKVTVAKEGEVIKPGLCYIAPGGYHTVIEIQEENEVSEKLFHLNKEPYVNGYRPSIDVLMKSCARKFGKKTVGIILTGMGKDGIEGMRAINAAGGYTIAQSLDTAVIDSMPKAVVDAGIAHDILSPDNIIKKINELFKK
jgi:two-component system chemotaxis response regulator CheB